MLPLSFFQSRVFSASSAVVLMVGFAMFGIFYFVTLYFQNVLGYSALQAGVRSLPLTMMVIFVAPIAGRMSGRVPPRYQMTVGMLMMTAGLLQLSRLQVDSSYNMIWPAYIVAGIGIAMTMPAVSAAGMGAVDHAKAGVASGVINASRQVGGALGVAVLGAVVSTRVDSVWTHGQALVPLVTGGQGAKIHRAGDQPGRLTGGRKRAREPGAARLCARRSGGDAGGRGAGLLGGDDGLLRAAARAGREPGPGCCGGRGVANRNRRWPAPLGAALGSVRRAGWMMSWPRTIVASSVSQTSPAPHSSWNQSSSVGLWRAAPT